jgi:hypothetical protein
MKLSLTFLFAAISERSPINADFGPLSLKYKESHVTDGNSGKLNQR